MIGTQERYFEDIDIGDSIPPRQHGPLTIVDTVRWAGLQEIRNICTTIGITCGNIIDLRLS